MTAALDATAPDVILEARALVKHFPVRRRLLGSPTGPVHAVCDVSFTVARGETLGLVGESGCGKSTTGLLALGLLPPTSGSVRFAGQDLAEMRGATLRSLRTRMQIVFQDSLASLDPRMTVGASVAEPLRIHRRNRDDEGDRVGELLTLVELDPDVAGRYPHEFSGGQRQRIGIARALALRPDLIVLDEPVSSLDMSVRAGVVNLLADLQEQLGVSYLFVAHDLSVVRHVSHRVAVMHLGRIVETGASHDVLRRPLHPYTQALLSAVPSVDPEVRRRQQRIVLEGDPPDPASPPSGCRFRTRCWKAETVCTEGEPALVDQGDGHLVACHFAAPPERSAAPP